MTEPTPEPIDYDVPVPPFLASLPGVRSLVPEARLVTGAGPPPDGTFGVTEAQVREWVIELTGVAAMDLDGWERLSETPDDDPLYGDAGTYGSGTYGAPTLGDKGKFIEWARTVIHNGAASYLEDARHPERSSTNQTAYGAVLWQRYTDGLDRLSAWLTRRLAADEAGDTPEGSSAAYAFPCPTFADDFRR